MSAKLNDKANPDTTSLIRKLYRTCVECVRRLEQSTKDKRNVKNIFESDVVCARNKLRECCEKLMFLNPVDFGRKAEDMIWKKCFYDPIQICRLNRDKLTEEELSWACLLMASAAGYYHSLLIRIQQELNIGLTTSFSRLSLQWRSQPEAKKKELKEWAVQAVHKTMIYLGDLARYQVDFQSEKVFNGHMTLSEHYYAEAIAIRPFHGMPHNQLGTLFGTRNYGVDAVYHYMRCLDSEDSFDGAKGNLLQVFKRNDELYETVTNGPISDDEHGKVKQFLVRFLYLVGALFQDKRDVNLGNRLQLLCQEDLEALEKCLPLLRGEETPMESASLRHMDSNLLLKLVIIMMILVKKLQTEESSKLSAAIALFLSSLSHILNHVCKQLAAWPSENHRGHNAEDNANQTVEVELNPESDDTISHMPAADDTFGAPDTASDDGKNANETRTDTPPPVIRRRRADSSDEEALENGQNSAESEDETEEEDVIELSDESEADAGGQETEWAKMVEKELSPRQSPLDSGCQSGEVPLGQQQNNGVLACEQTAEEERKCFSDLPFDEQLRNLVGMDFLMVIKVSCDWFRCNPNLIVSMAEVNVTIKIFTSKLLWGRMAGLLNILPHEDTVLGFVKNDRSLKRKLVGEISSPLSDWYQKVPLLEDVALRGLSSLTQVHTGLDFSSVRRVVDADVECLVRLFSIRSFGSYLIRLNTAGFHYDREQKKYVSDFGPSLVERIPADEDKNFDKKNSLMRSMATLRAKDELAQFDRIGWIPVYVVPETAVLMNKLSAMKLLVGAQRFVCVIPKYILQELDGLKTESAGAREAIRFLETCFTQGNKYVRQQKIVERMETASKDKVLSKELAEILNCCSYLCGKVNSSGGTVIATILTSHKPGSQEFKNLEDPVKTADIAGVNVEFIHRFWSRWQAYRKKGG